MTKAEAIHAFFASFDLPAYEEHSVPHWLDDAQTTENQPPYITYEYAESWYFGETVFTTANIWDCSGAWTFLDAKTKELADAIGHFKVLQCDAGKIIVCKGSPFAQSLGDGTYKRRYLNLMLTFVTN